MLVLEAGQSVTHLQFLPDSRRLLVGLSTPKGPSGIEVWTLPGGPRVRLPLPILSEGSWWRMQYRNWLAVHPSGKWCYIAWNGRLVSLTAEGEVRPVPKDVEAHQVVVSPDGASVVTAHVTESQRQLTTFRTAQADPTVVRRSMPTNFRFLAGFLPDNESLITIEEGVRIGTPFEDDAQAKSRTPKCLGSRPQISPDGRYLGVMGYSSMYVYDLPALGKPRQIKSSTNFGDFRSIAFHPNGKTMAVIHGGPTLVKQYELPDLRLRHKYKWNLGPLESIAYSPDGTLGAAGSTDGRVVVWDVEG